MDPKYSNIFWHQGIKLFKNKILNSESGRVKVEHLENDVTKALINLFQHCSGKVLRSFLQLVGVKQAPDSFEFDFQVTDTERYRYKKQRIMLAIISSATQMKSDPLYSVDKGRPDACIYNKDIAILIEAKTQSPLIKEQIESYVKHYLESTTKNRTITWEDISEKLNLIIDKIHPTDKFLVSQFNDFLELIGIAEFNGFSETDFSMIGSIGKITRDDFLDFKRTFHRKIEKFMTLLDKEIKQEIDFKNYSNKVARVSANIPGVWSAFYFYDDNPDIHVNKYPNLNLIYKEQGIELTLNAEIKTSVERMIRHIGGEPKKFNKLKDSLNEQNLYVYYKLQCLPMDHFVWNLIPGYPKRMNLLKADEIISSINKFGKGWLDFRDTLLFQMKSGMIKHPSGRFFNETELNYAENYNDKSTYCIRIGKQYPTSEIVGMKKKLIPFFKREVLKLKKITKFIVA